MKLQYRKSVNTRKYHTFKSAVKKIVITALLLTATYVAGVYEFHNTLIQGYKSIEAYSQTYDKVCADSVCSQVIEVKKETK
jgi:hypothetical protein